MFLKVLFCILNHILYTLFTTCFFLGITFSDIFEKDFIAGLFGMYQSLEIDRRKQISVLLPRIYGTGYTQRVLKD